MGPLPVSRVLAAAGLASAAACGFVPDRPTFASEVSADTRAALVEADVSAPDVAAARIGGALELYFGSPSAPGYHLTDAWVEDERDPGDAWWELSDEAVDAVREGNGRRFAAQIGAVRAAVEAGETALPDIPRPLRGGESLARFEAAFAPLVSGEVELGSLHPDSPTEEESSEDDPSFTWGDEALRFWESYYPTLEESAELYRTRCLFCHGSLGAGDGPTGRTLDPRPRDLRDGIFKWTEVGANRRPTRDGLVRLLQRGVRGTAMPAFRRLSRGELEGLVDWIRYLAVRGETEQLSTYFACEEGDVRPASVERAYGTVWGRWDEAEDHWLAVPAGPSPAEVTAEVVARGAELFRGSLANCASCHGASGEGDGEAIWEEGEEGERRRRLDRWGQPSHPRNLTAGVFRGGGRPVDLYRRIKSGIGGTIMPAADASLTDDDLWALVHFVLSLSRTGEEAAR